MSYYATYNLGKDQWLKWQNESGILIEFNHGMIAPHGITPYIDVRHGDGFKTRIYRTGQVYEVVETKDNPPRQEFHRMNYWVKF